MISPTILDRRVRTPLEQPPKYILASLSLRRIRNSRPPMIRQRPDRVRLVDFHPLLLDQESQHRHPLRLVGRVTGGRALRCPVQRPPAYPRVVLAEQLEAGHGA